VRRLVPSIALALALVAGCGGEGRGGGAAQQEIDAPPGTLRARPGPGGGACSPGTYRLALAGARPAILRVGPGEGGGPRAFLLAFHGANGTYRDALWAFRAAWDVRGLVILAPTSPGRTWWPGDDVAFVDRVLRKAFARCRVDLRRVAVGGFSDGATYALSLGLENGRLFKSVIAFSPGGALVERPMGKPRVFISHGRNDEVLPIAKTSDSIVPRLRDAGYSVTYRRFGDGHAVPAGISRAAVGWLTRR
jgi:phospholipase/carboxylesterase